MTKHYDASDPAAIEAVASEVELKERNELHDVACILDLPAGMRFFRDMFVLGHVESPCFTGNSNTFYNLGLRDFALKYWKLVKRANPKAFAAIITDMETDD